MSFDMTSFLGNLQPLAAETVHWADGTLPLRVTTYLTPAEPPLDYVSTVRAMLLRGEEVMVIRDMSGFVHILPGGRREQGETIEQTLRREIMEETGWTITDVSPLGFLHFHHLAPRPEGYRYPYPDFFQRVFRSHADVPAPEMREVNGHEVEAVFHAVADLEALGVPLSQRLLLQRALPEKPQL